MEKSTPSLLQRRAQTGMKSAQGRAECARGCLLLPTQAGPLQTPGPSIPHEGTRGRYLGGWLPGLNSPQVLVQFRAQLGQLSLQQDLGWMMGKDLGSGKGEGRG